MENWGFVLIQKGSNSKKEVYGYTEPLKDWTKFTTKNIEKEKRKK
jgi:hypothetical protein